MIAAAAVWLSVAVGPFDTYAECEAMKEKIDPPAKVVKYQCNGVEEGSPYAPKKAPIPVSRPK